MGKLKELLIQLREQEARNDPHIDDGYYYQQLQAQYSPENLNLNQQQNGNSNSMPQIEGATK